MASAKTYIPRTDLGFPDRRTSNRFEWSFSDEADAEQWERDDRSDRVDLGATPSVDRAANR